MVSARRARGPVRYPVWQRGERRRSRKRTPQRGTQRTLAVHKGDVELTRYQAPATFFPWPHVQKAIDSIDAQVYRTAIQFAREGLGEAKACPSCGRPSGELFWVCVSSSEADWDAGEGKVGFLTICETCRVQTDFLLDPELTDQQAEAWRDFRLLF